MSSPIHQSEDLDPALRYAPPWARDRISLAGRPHPPPARRPLPGARPEFSGDRAMMDLQRQLLLDPDAIPEPAVDDARTLKPIVLRLSGVMGLAALIAWGVVSLPAIKNVAEIVPLDVKTQAMASDRFTPLQAPMREAASQLSEPQTAANSVPQSSQGQAAMNDAPPPAASLQPAGSLACARARSHAAPQAAPRCRQQCRLRRRPSRRLRRWYRRMQRRRQPMPRRRRSTMRKLPR